VPVIVRLGHQPIHLKDVLTLGPGAIIELTKSADKPLDLLINNKPIGEGSAVKLGENFGIRVTQVESASNRALAMGE
jgi:flagellar motor switch protein FliN/FliY